MKGWNLDIYKGIPEMKVIIRAYTVIEKRKHGERLGLDTLVVHALKDGCSLSEIFEGLAKALSTPPGKYVRKNGTQRN